MDDGQGDRGDVGKQPHLQQAINYLPGWTLDIANQIVLREGGHGVLQQEAGEEEGVEDGEAVEQVRKAPFQFDILLVKCPHT